MKVSLNWLREYVDFSGDVSELSQLLTMAGVEVEGVETRGVTIDKVVVAQVLASEQHPNADRLSVCKVDDGSGTPRQIVCGAKNYRVGDKVPLALPGAVMPGDFKIKIGKLRGVESEGMMCSAKELALSEESEGLLILSPSATVGTPISELFPADTVLDLEITPNRPDLLSHIGIAREVAALSGCELKVTTHVVKAESQFAGTLTIEADECPFYTARRISAIKVGPSPAWLKEKLEVLGLRSINNIVDITNYVMLETGQPLHAFDAAKLTGEIRVRMANDGEGFLALDGRTYQLRVTDLVIADAERAVALAGVMGGEETGVTDTTSEIILESADFQSSTIRATSRSLGILTDSSYRFEREVDPAGVLVASQRAAELIEELAGGEIGELKVGFGANSQFGFDPEAAREGHAYTGVVPVRVERCSEVLGMDVPEWCIDKILTAFGLRKTDAGWEIPSFRPDLTREVDLIEEVARVIGIDEVPTCDIARFTESSPADGAHDRLMTLRQALVAQGLYEARSLTLISEKALQRSFQAHGVLRVRNPLNEDQVVLRPSLVPGLLDAVARNTRAGAKSVRLFEVGKVFSSEQPEERIHLGVALSGDVQATSWRETTGRAADLLDLKGLLSRILGTPVEFLKSQHSGLGVFVTVQLDGKDAGYAGQLWPADARELDATSPVIFAEIDLSQVVEAPATAKRYREVPRFPAVTRDIALLAPVDLPHGQIAAVLNGGNEPLLAGVELFDIFTDSTGEKVPADKKSVAYSLTYRAGDRTLTADEVNAVHNRLKERLRNELGIQLRE